MSPSATIAIVVVALVFCAWVFQSDTKDPGYEAWLKRQQNERPVDTAQKASMGIAVTDAGVTKDSSTVSSRGGQVVGNAPRPVESGVTVQGAPTFNALLSAPVDDANPPEPANTRPGFGANAKLEGTYVGVAFLGDSGAEASADTPTITFRRDGTFVTQNMIASGSDIDPGAAALERGSGRYTLSVNLLELNYTDGLARKSGSRRTYMVVPVEGDEAAPVTLTVQGRIFKRGGAR